MLQQGLVLLVAGMGIAIGFLFILSIVTRGMSRLVPYVNVFPDPAPKKAGRPQAASDDEAVAVAIAVASRR